MASRRHGGRGEADGATGRDQAGSGMGVWGVMFRIDAEGVVVRIGKVGEGVAGLGKRRGEGLLNGG